MPAVAITDGRHQEKDQAGDGKSCSCHMDGSDGEFFPKGISGAFPGSDHMGYEWGIFFISINSD
jgi:hypothetical protein